MTSPASKTSLFDGMWAVKQGSSNDDARIIDRPYIYAQEVVYRVRLKFVWG